MYLAQCNFPRIETLQSQCVLWHGNVTSERSINKITTTGTAPDRARLEIPIAITIIFIILQRQREAAVIDWLLKSRQNISEYDRVICISFALYTCRISTRYIARYDVDATTIILKAYYLRALIKILVWKQKDLFPERERAKRERGGREKREKQRRKRMRWWTEILNFRCFVLVTMVVRFISVSLCQGKRNKRRKKKESNTLWEATIASSD